MTPGEGDPGAKLPTSSAAPRSAEELEQHQDRTADGRYDEGSHTHEDTPADHPAGEGGDVNAQEALHARIENDFVYHTPKSGQPELYVEIRDQAKALAHFLVDSVPPSRELSLALTKLEESVMHANAGIARHG